MNCWELSRFAPASITHKRTAWWNDLIVRWKQWFKSSFTKTPKIGTNGWNPFCSLCGRSRKPPRGFPPSSSCMGASPAGSWTSWGRLGREEGPSESKNEIQHVLDLRTKLHTLGQLSMESLLQAQDKQSRLYNRGTRLRKFAPGDKVLVLLPTSSSKLLAKWQGPFEVTRRVGDLNYEVVQTDRSGARQIYHLNLLKKWSKVEPVMLATAVSGEDDLGPEVITKIQSLTLAPGGDLHSPSQLTDVARLQKDFADVFSPSARANQSHPAPYWDGAGRRSAQSAVSLTGTQKKSGSVRIRGNVRDGSNRRIPQWLGEPDRFGTENRRLGSVLCGLSQSECGVEVRRLSNATGWRVAWSAGYRSFLFDAGLNQRILADPLIALIQRKVSLHKAVWITPICHTSVWVVRGARYLSAPHGQNPPTAHRICRCLSGWHYHLQSGLAAAYGAPAGGAESAEGSGANGQPKEVCDWAGGGSLSGVPLGSRAGASPNW